jgi:hypothetical protein
LKITTDVLSQRDSSFSGRESERERDSPVPRVERKKKKKKRVAYIMRDMKRLSRWQHFLCAAHFAFP